MRGRQPSGPEFVDKLDGSAEAKQRAKTVLETLAGKCRVQKACERLGVKEARFDQLRIEALQAMIDALERQPAGRPARTVTAAEEKNRQLQARIDELEVKLALAPLQVELGVLLPEVVNKPGPKIELAGPSPEVVDTPATKSESAGPSPEVVDAPATKSESAELSPEVVDKPAKKNDREFPGTGPGLPNQANVVSNLKNLIANEAMPKGPRSAASRASVSSANRNKWFAAMLSKWDRSYSSAAGAGL